MLSGTGCYRLTLHEQNGFYIVNTVIQFCICNDYLSRLTQNLEAAAIYLCGSIITFRES